VSAATQATIHASAVTQHHCDEKRPILAGTCPS
jgi:hypothetical protein